MRLIKYILLLLIFAGVSLTPLQAAETEGLPPKAPTVFNIGPFPVTNSMLVTWIVAILVIVFAQYSTRNMKDVPDGAQNFWEFLVESLYLFLEEIVGADLIKKTFWFFATIFIFIFFTNWFGLLPGVGTIGWGHQTTDGFEITKPLFRGGNADLNMTFAMAAIFMVKSALPPRNSGNADLNMTFAMAAKVMF